MVISVETRNLYLGDTSRLETLATQLNVTFFAALSLLIHL